MANGALNERVYFAARSPKTIGEALCKKVEALEADWGADNRSEMENAYCHVYGRDVGYGSPSGITRGGERGELAMLRVPSAPANARAKHSLVSSAKLSWKPQAKDGTADAAKGTKLGSDLLEDEWKSNRLSTVCSLWLEHTIYFSEAFVFPKWDKSAGPPLLASEDKLINQGDTVYHNVPAWDVFRDNNAKSFKACPWLFCRLFENRWDLAKTTRRLADGREGDEAAEAILSACDALSSKYISNTQRQRMTETDLVPVWYFMHHPSAALPMGRMVAFLGGKVVLTDQPIRGPNATYEGMPLVRMVDREMVDSPHAWAIFWDLLGSQEIQDGIDTSLATRSTTTGNPVLTYEKGSDVSPEAIGPYRTWQYPRGAKPPQELEWGKFPTEFLEYRRDLQSNQRSGMGLNDVAMGQPQGADMNAQAFTVLYSAAVQQSAPLQENYTTSVAQLGATVLKLKAKHVKQERSFQAPGSSGRRIKYTGEDLACIDAVFVEVGNPMEQTAAGRKIILDDKITKGWIINEAAYDQCLATGRSEPASLRNTEEMTLIQREYEMLCAGESPKVDSWQNHQLHYRENSAAALGTKDDSVKNLVEQHLEEHYVAMFGVPRAADPMAHMRERWMLGMPIGPGQDQPTPPLGGAPPLGAPGAPPTGPAGPPGEESPPPPDAAPNAAQDVAPPTNPLTGAPFDPTTGGGVVAPN